MLWPVRVTGNVAIEHLVEHLNRGLFLAPKATANDEVGGCLQLAAHLEQTTSKLDIVLDGTIPLRMRDDHVISHALNGKDRTLVFVEVRLSTVRIESSRNSPVPSNPR